MSRRSTPPSHRSSPTSPDPRRAEAAAQGGSVGPFDPLVVREALLREHYRGGQSFYVCPRVSDLAERKEFLEKVVPEENGVQQFLAEMRPL
mgnify:CR=1 FL=1